MKLHNRTNTNSCHFRFQVNIEYNFNHCECFKLVNSRTERTWLLCTFNVYDQTRMFRSWEYY